MKRLIAVAVVSLLLGSLAGPLWTASAPPTLAPLVMSAPAPDLTNVQRARIMMDLVQDGDVATPAAYADVDLAGVAVATKYANAVAAFFPDGPVGGTENAKAAFYLKHVRKWHREILLATRVPTDTSAEEAALAAAKAAAEAAAAAEVDDDLGPDA